MITHPVLDTFIYLGCFIGVPPIVCGLAAIYRRWRGGGLAK